MSEKLENKHGGSVNVKPLVICDNCHCSFEFDGNYARVLCDCCQAGHDAIEYAEIDFQIEQDEKFYKLTGKTVDEFYADHQYHPLQDIIL